MKIAVSSSGMDLDAAIDPRFGRCQYFIVVETEDLRYEAVENESGTLGGGAGIQAAQDVIARGATAVLTGNCGPNAVQILSEARIDLYTGLSGSVRTAIERFQHGELAPATGPNVPVHNGQSGAPAGGAGLSGGPARGSGMGGGGGRGMGGGGGRCMGGGGGRCIPGGQGTGPGSAESIDDLKQQAADLRQQLEAMNSRIRDIENN